MPGKEAVALRAGFRQRAKAALEKLFTRVGVPSVGRVVGRRSALVLAYHNIVPDAAPWPGERSLHLPRADFARQLDRLGLTHDVVGIDELLTPPSNVRRPRAVITFDDAYRGALEFGLPELTERGMPATVFVAPGLLGDRAFWWDLLAAPDTGEVHADRRGHALKELRGEQRRILGYGADFTQARGKPPPYSRSATDHELEEAVRKHDLVLGSHTWNHPNLTELDEDEILEEFVRSLQWLRDRFSSVVPWIAYPYGLLDDRVAQKARDVFEGGLSLEGRLVPSSIEGSLRFRVPRVNIPAGLSLEGFELRISGVMRR